VIDRRLEAEFGDLVRPGLLVLLKSPVDYLLRNIRERRRDEETLRSDDLPEGLTRLVRALNPRYDAIAVTLQANGWYRGPVLVIDVSKIDFVSNVRHLIAVYEGIETLLVPKDFRA
jgi:deoxyadenosine/deoxycytidine kinase